MGSRGAMLQSGGFKTPPQWKMIDMIGGIKVLVPKDSKKSLSLPERSNTPQTMYLLLRKDGTFSQLRIFGADRIPRTDIDFGTHNGKKSLHAHDYKDGNRSKSPRSLTDSEKKKYNVLFAGVKGD